MGDHLQPPHVRQPYTPPPQKPDEVEPETEMFTSNSLQHKTGVEDLSVSPSPTDYARQSIVRTKKRKSISDAPTVGAMLRRALINHQLGLTVNLVLLVALSWLCFPSLRPKLEGFYSLCYKSTMQENMYASGPRDFKLVVAFIVVFTGFRAFMLDYVLLPLASVCNIRSKKLKVRFAEQTYLILYYGTYWSWGVYLFCRDTPSSLLIAADGSQPLTISSLLISLWTYYPRLAVDAQMKLYYLSQLAFWTQQIIVVHLEERRKDHYQMLTHHFVTVALLIGSYGYRQMRVGNAVLICMDIIDLIFPTAKILKYLGYQTACDLAFAMFVVTWLACRHVAYLSICWSIYAHVHEVVMPYGLYSINVAEPKMPVKDIVSGLRLSNDGGKNVWSNVFQPYLNPSATTVAFNANIRWSFLGLLLGLQCITILWFLMICRVVARVLRGEGADDSRSDDEELGVDDGSAAELEDVFDDVTLQDKSFGTLPPTSPAETTYQRYIEVEASADDLAAATVASSSTRRTSKRKTKGLSTGLNLGEHKEILNRIGCLSAEQLAREREKRSPDPALPSSSSKR